MIKNTTENWKNMEVVQDKPGIRMEHKIPYGKERKMNKV